MGLRQSRAKRKARVTQTQKVNNCICQHHICQVKVEVALTRTEIEASQRTNVTKQRQS